MSLVTRVSVAFLVALALALGGLPQQAGAATELARRLGYDVRVEPDLAGRPRALVARAAL